MEHEALEGRRLALLVWGEHPDGTEDVAVFTGSVVRDGGRLTMVDASGGWLLRIEEEWLERIRPVEPQLREALLEADFRLSLSVGPLPQDGSANDCLRTGLVWPRDDDEQADEGA